MNGYTTSKMVLSCHHPYYNISFIHGYIIPCVHFIKGSIDPIQYPVPTHGYTTPHDNFVDVPSGMTQSNPQFQYMGIPPHMIILSMYQQA